jgi:putative transcriptional regulator
MKPAIGAFAACVLIFGACMARANDLGKPMLLVATPTLQGPYSGTVLIAVPVGDEHFGFILNRPTGTQLAKVFPGHAPSAKVLDPIYFGGPELTQGIFALRRGDPGRPSLHLFGDLFATGNARVVDAIIEQTPNEARYFAGFVSWRPNELAREIASGYWYVGDADEAQVLRRDTDALWQDLLQRFGKAGAPDRQAPAIRAPLQRTSPGARMEHLT